MLYFIKSNIYSPKLVYIQHLKLKRWFIWNRKIPTKRIRSELINQIMVHMRLPLSIFQNSHTPLLFHCYFRLSYGFSSSGKHQMAFWCDWKSNRTKCIRFDNGSYFCFDERIYSYIDNRRTSPYVFRLTYCLSHREIEYFLWIGKCVLFGWKCTALVDVLKI